MKSTLIWFLLCQLIVYSFSCDKKTLIKVKPNSNDLIGYYESTDFIENKKSKLIIINDDILSAENIPIRDYGVENFQEINWETTNSTPSGEWCIYFDDVFMQIYKYDNNYIFVYKYDVIKNKEIIFKKVN